MSSSRAAGRGFTLVEVMVVVGIVGLLASVAVSQFERYQLRSKAAERAVVMVAIGQAVNDVVMQRDSLEQRVPDDSFGGAWNPTGQPGKMKRPFDWTLPGWTRLPMVVQGGSYYSYTFLAEDPTPKGTNVILTIQAQGDLDGDTRPSFKTYSYVATGYVFHLVDEDPKRGAEDWETF